LAPALAALGLFLVYTRTLNPGPSLIDGVEYAVAAHVLGIPHSAGYAVFVQLGKLLCLVPLLDVGARVNLLAAIGGAAMGGLLVGLVLRISGSAAAGLLAALLLGLAPVTWSQAVTGEVYTLHLVVILAFLLAVERALRPGGGGRWIVLAALIVGVGITNHQLALLLLPALGLAAWYARRRLGLRGLATATVAGMLGLSITLYLPLRAAQQPLLNRGDPSNLAGLRHVVLKRAEVSVSDLEGNPWEVKRLQLAHYLRESVRLAWAPWLLLVLPGLWRLARARPRLLLVLLAVHLVNLGVVVVSFWTPTPAILYMIEPFYLPAHLVVVVLAGVGFAVLLQWLSRRRAAGAAWALPGPLAAGALALFGLHALVGGWAANDVRDHHLVRDWAENVFLSVPGDAILLAGLDEYFPLLYAQVVEGKARGVTAKHILTLARNPETWWRGERLEPMSEGYDERGRSLRDEAELTALVRRALRSYLEGARAPRPIFFSNFNAGYFPKGTQPGLEGIVYRLCREGEPCTRDPGRLWRFYRLRGVAPPRVRLDEAERQLAHNYAVALNNLGGYWIMRGQPERAVRAFRRALELEPENSVALRYLARLRGEQGA
jgi:hypothetical protein